MVLPSISADRGGSLGRKHVERPTPPLSKSPHRRPAKKNNKAITRTHCCQQCVRDLQPSELHLPKLAPESIMLTSQIGKEDTFTNVIDSLTEANRVPEVSAQLWNSSCSQSAASTPRFPSSMQSDYSPELDTNQFSPTEPSHTVTIISEVPPAPNVIHIPLERLLDSDDSVQRVTIRCSKYDEIGNPQARKKKHRRALSGKKWHRASSYANAGVVQGQSKKEKLNFMDTQLNSIYNAWEKAKIDEQLSPRERRKELPAKLAPLPEIGSAEATDSSFKNISSKSVERYVFNAMMRAQRAAKFECKIPTIPLSLKTKAKKLGIQNTVVR